MSKPAVSPSNPSRIQPEFNPELDGVRGLFMAGVFLFHCAPSQILGFPVQGFFGSLWMSIDVFFALSGFLITRNLLDDIGNRHRFLNFYVNRALRIIPAFMLALFLVFAVLPLNSIIAKAIERTPNVWWFLTYTFNFKVMLDNGWPQSLLMSHFWSLCVEEQFYFIWPLVIYLFRGRALALVIAAFFLVALLAEIYFYAKGVHWAVMHSNLLTRLDSLGVGALVALLHRSPWRLKFRRHFTLAFYFSSVVLLFCAIKTGGLRFTGWHSHLIVGPMLMVWSSALVYLLINAREQHPYLNAVFRAPLFTWLGKYSYGIYIYHWLVYMTVVELDAFGWRTGHAWLNFGLVVVLTLVIAQLSYQGLERWCLRLKLRHYEPFDPAAGVVGTAPDTVSQEPPQPAQSSIQNR